MIPQTNESWLNNKWRPAVAWAYLAICCFDFVVAPILWSLLQAYQSGMVSQQWEPITLAGAGLFHAAMGAVLGINAWTRGKEKLERDRYEYDDRDYRSKRGRYESDEPRVTYRPRGGEDDRE